ncbi:MAG TPA: hypothetical protein DDX75_08520 [Phycisphaerales bacterium]|nr:hypothetical protein [Phycisphaerales bacterium]
MSDGTFYNWKAKYGGLSLNEAKRVKLLEDENRRLRHIVGDQVLEIQHSRVLSQKTFKA